MTTIATRSHEKRTAFHTKTFWQERSVKKLLEVGQPQPHQTSHCPKSVPDVPRSPTAPVPPSSKQCKILQRNKRQEKELSLVLVIFLQRKNWEFGLFSNGPSRLKIRGWSLGRVCSFKLWKYQNKRKISYILFQGNNPCFNYMSLFKLADASGAI